MGLHLYHSWAFGVVFEGVVLPRYAGAGQAQELGGSQNLHSVMIQTVSQGFLHFCSCDVSGSSPLQKTDCTGYKILMWILKVLSWHARLQWMLDLDKNWKGTKICSLLMMTAGHNPIQH